MPALRTTAVAISVTLWEVVGPSKQISRNSCIARSVLSTRGQYASPIRHDLPSHCKKWRDLKTALAEALVVLSIWVYRVVFTRHDGLKRREEVGTGEPIETGGLD